MAERIRFHLDEHVDPRIAEALRRHGVDVTTTVSVGLRTQSDSVQWEFAQRERRVLVTQDDDFLRMADQGMDHAGIAYCASGSRSIGDMVRSLILPYEVLAPRTRPR